MIIPTESYEAIFDHYQEAIRWMEGLGVKLGPGRTSHYEKVVRYWKDAYRTAPAEEGEKVYPDFVSSMFEIHDFVAIYQALKDVPRDQLTSVVEKLKKGVNGPINAADETPESTAARNFLFEAVVSAKSHCPNRGIETIFNAPSDTGILIGGKRIWVECKRVTNIDAIENNVRKASSQLEKVLNKAVGSGHRGIVALDISKILNRGDNIYVTENDYQLRASVEKMMDKFIEENFRAWENVYARRHRKIIGTFIRFTFMSSSEARNILVHTSQWAVNPRLGINSSDDQILRELVSALEAT